MFRTLKIFAVMFTLTTAFAFAQTAPSTVNLPSEDTVNSFFHWMFGQEAAMQWKIEAIKPSNVKGLAEVDALLTVPQGKQQMVLYVSQDGTQAIVGDVIPFGPDPFAADRDKLKAFTGTAIGPTDSPITIVEFSDLQCPHCKVAHPIIEKLRADEPNVRFVFQNFPLPMHNWAAKAANYADCVGQKTPDLMMKFVGAVFEDQENITEATADDKLNAAATKAGADPAATAACALLPATTTRVQKSIEFGKTLDVTGTPTLFINGRRIANVSGAPYEVLKSIVDFHVKETQDKSGKK